MSEKNLVIIHTFVLGSAAVLVFIGYLNSINGYEFTHQMATGMTGMRASRLIAGFLPFFGMATLLWGGAYKTYKKVIVYIIALATLPAGLLLIGSQFGIFHFSESTILGLGFYCVVFNPLLILLILNRFATKSVRLR